VKRLLVLPFLMALFWPGVAFADPAADLSVTGVTASAGQVSFLASARGLPSGTSLAQAQLTVRIGDRELPATIGEAVTAKPEPRAVVVVIDTSGSMAGSRIAAARKAAAEYAKTLPADVRLGLVAVAQPSRILLAPTTDRAAYTRAVAALSARGGTALYDGVAQAANVLGSSGARRILVLSDGDDTASKTTASGVQATLRDGGVIADVVGFQVTSGAAVKQLATGSGGRVFAAADARALAAAFRFAAASFSAPVRITAKIPRALDGRVAAIEVRANLAGRTVTAATVPVHLTSARFETAPLPETTVPRPPPWLAQVAVLVVFLSLFLLLASVLRPALARAHQRRRIGQISKFTSSAAPVAASGARGGSLIQGALNLSERMVTKRGSREKLAQELDRAGMSFRPHEWLLLRVAVAAGSALLLSVLFGGLGFVPGALVGWLVTRFYRTSRTGRRTKKFAGQLPDALQLVVGSLQSGFSLPQAVSAVVKDTEEPLGPELGRALASTRLGGTLEDGLEAVANRVGSQDLSWAVMTIRIQREVGGNLAEVLETAVATMREREGLRRHVKALSAEGRLSAYVLTGMPIGVAGWMFMLRREYLEPLYTTAIGIGMLIASVTMVTFGAWWMSKLVKVDV
jgi:Flp pilus assembly protein TadB/Mg-chelatase subunit ChlD